MPSNLDFNSTKKFRDYIISKTLTHPNGPRSFTEQSYSVKQLSDMSNIDQPDVDNDRDRDLEQHQRYNTYKPDGYYIKEDIETLPRTRNLSLYPYFTTKKHTLIGIMTNDDYENESELFKFAAKTIKTDENGPVFSRIRQNLGTYINSRVRILDALNGSLSTGINLLTGRESILQYDYSITKNKTIAGKSINFLETITGIEAPWSKIPGNYLSNPDVEVVNKNERNTEVGRLIQDTTGAIGSLFGIQRRSSSDRKPSDLFIEYMGEGQRQTLFSLLSYSKYAPNYTTTARSQNTSKIFNFVDKIGMGIKESLGIEAPIGVSYIGDDRGNDVKFAMGDFNNNQVRSPYYLSIMFDPILSKFHESRNFTDNGNVTGNLTWVSKNSQVNLKNQDLIGGSISTKYEFREDSILGYTQDLLDTMPSGGESFSHVGSVINQTSRYFEEGGKKISRGSAVKYVDKNGRSTGMEYSRVWTKDNPYLTYSNLIKKTGNIRKYDGTVVSNTWNLNIAPVSNGNKDFTSSTNISRSGEQYNNTFYAKKYMFSIENLAWKSSITNGRTVQDLPYSERGPNGGRIMWFPPYDLSVSEQNNAAWETNKFIGRPEPIYTYQGTERSGQVSFRIIVDHPSVLNLLVREHFKNMTDSETEDYINAFFAGSVDIDFYDLIQRYRNLDKDDIQTILNYLNKGVDPTNTDSIKEVEQYVTNIPETSSLSPQSKNTSSSFVLMYFNNTPQSNDLTTPYTKIYQTTIGVENERNKLKNKYHELLTDLLSGSNAKTSNYIHDKNIIFGSDITNPETFNETISKQMELFDGTINKNTEYYNGYVVLLNTIKEKIKLGEVENIVFEIKSTTTKLGNEKDNQKLSERRSVSIVNDIIDQLKENSGTNVHHEFLKKLLVAGTSSVDGVKSGRETLSVTYKDLGYAVNVSDSENKGRIFFHITSTGEESLSPLEFKNRELDITSPKSFLSRNSMIRVSYDEIAPQIDDDRVNNNPRSSRTITLQNESTPPKTPYNQKPSIDVMKRIIMRVLQEGYYFKKLEETDPIVFKTLREKLKYFHPAFHSMTPEGLNSRLTFLLQAVRPGNTISVKNDKGVVDNESNASNTTFGPPPICVLRIGDFYHSKIVIKDVQISYDENLWDINPEGIGMQPMIAKVTMQINFIGGQGLEKPIDRLQNALSSNFFANTEIYDERSENSSNTINGKDTNTFTKEFLEELINPKESSGSVYGDTKQYNNITSGVFIGDISGNKINYENVINKLIDETETYHMVYESSYKTLLPKYGEKLSSILFSPRYRTINQYDVYTTNGESPSKTISLFGVYKRSNGISNLIETITSRMSDTINSLHESGELHEIFSMENIVPSKILNSKKDAIYREVKEIITKTIDEMVTESSIKELEKSRNSLIGSLDKNNVIVKYGGDVKMSKPFPIHVKLSGFTSEGFYSSYSSCVDVIEENRNIIDSHIDESFDFIKN
jgi:hypothetical protein